MEESITQRENNLNKPFMFVENESPQLENKCSTPQSHQNTRSFRETIRIFK